VRGGKSKSDRRVQVTATPSQFVSNWQMGVASLDPSYGGIPAIVRSCPTAVAPGGQTRYTATVNSKTPATPEAAMYEGNSVLCPVNSVFFPLTSDSWQP
jgi:hypothetical protein